MANESKTERGLDSEGDIEPDTENGFREYEDEWQELIIRHTFVKGSEHTHMDAQMARYRAPGKMSHRRTTTHVSIFAPCVCLWVWILWLTVLLHRPYGSVRSMKKTVNKQKTNCRKLVIEKKDLKKTTQQNHEVSSSWPTSESCYFHIYALLLEYLIG